MKSKLFVDLRKGSSFINNFTFKPEKCFRAFDADQKDRNLYVSIEEVRKHDPKLAEKLEQD